MCLDVRASGGQGTDLIAYGCHGGANQNWSIK